MSQDHIVVFSGGSAANNLVDVFGKLARDKECSLSYVIPISDNGGSSSELIRVFGGPGIGDVRSRLVRLIPEDPTGKDLEKSAIKTLFNHRLCPSPVEARIEWLDIVEARHPLWTHITSSKRELIRSFLNTINLEIVKRARPSSVFNFQSASVGNLFLTGARLFTGSFESSIYLLGSITGVPDNVNVIPAINYNFSHHISAGLEDGTVITGQNSISHPSAPAVPVLPVTDDEPTPRATSPLSPRTRDSHELSQHDLVEDANLPGSLPTLRKPYITFAKTQAAALPSRIARIWYINPYGQEIRPAANPAVVDTLAAAGCVVYSIGSLYTSLVPSLVLRGVGAVLAARRCCKVLVLNGTTDRETRAPGWEFGAVDFVQAIVDACDSSRGLKGVCSDYVTHVIHLHGEGTPRVDRDALAGLGVECVRVYGRKMDARDGDEGGMIYDGAALEQALAAIVGRRDSKADKLRRNTVESVHQSPRKSDG